MSTEEQTSTDAWGQPISHDRQGELQRYLIRWAGETDHGGREGALDGVRLTGADVHWLASQSGFDEQGERSNLQLQGANLGEAKLDKADLRGAHLEGANLVTAHLERAKLPGAHLNHAKLTGALLGRAELTRAHLQDAVLTGAHLEGAKLGRAQLQCANLVRTQFQRSYLHLAEMNNADLRGASFDKTSRLTSAILTGATLDQVTFDNTNLSVVDWRLVSVLGDELTAQTAKDKDGKRKKRQQRVEEYQAAARAYRRLAVALQANGLSEEASGYLYRAQIMQRRLAYRERRFGAYFFSVLLAVLAGYGYRLGRIVIAYLSVVLFFAALFLGARYLGGETIDVTQVTDALQISLNAIHGRVFFVQFGLDTAQSWIATIESVVGIVIEGVFVAMLIQRFFGK